MWPHKSWPIPSINSSRANAAWLGAREGWPLNEEPPNVLAQQFRGGCYEGHVGQNEFWTNQYFELHRQGLIKTVDERASALEGNVFGAAGSPEPQEAEQGVHCSYCDTQSI